MAALSTWIITLLPIAFVLNNLISLFRNIRVARATGTPYVIVPVYAYNRINSLLFGRTISRLCDAILNEPSSTSWRRLTGSAWPWKLRHTPFADLGTDTFLTVAPGGIILYTADADVISQISSRGNDFPKATQLYKHVDIYGKNVVSSGGSTWRRHRSVTGLAFTEKNNQLVWKETLDITQAMLNSWVGSGGGETTVRTVAGDAMLLSLGVIGRAGLGKKLDWPKVTDLEDNKRVLPPGHKLTFTEALQFLLEHIFYIIALPIWFQKNSPFKKLARCYEGYIEFGKYLKEMVAAKKASIKAGALKSSDKGLNVDLISQLLEAQKLSGSSKAEADQTVSLSDDDVMGNLFMFIIAGHETSANSIHFSIILLALHPSLQRKVQQELNSIFQDRPISSWSYDTDLRQLFNSLLAAVLNEELRLIGPVIAIPKIVSSTPQQLSINGRKCTFPAETMIRLCVSSVHHNPNFWPAGPPSRTPNSPRNRDNDLEEFKPERWIKLPLRKSMRTSSSSEPAAGKPLYVPPKGAFIPFSDGQRACLGKRFAQIEILAALAVIFSDYSVELAVDEWASDQEVSSMGKGERKAVWEKAEKKARGLLRDKVSSIITLQLRGAHIPVRFVKKGAERFGDI